MAVYLSISNGIPLIPHLLNKNTDGSTRLTTGKDRVGGGNTWLIRYLAFGFAGQYLTHGSVESELLALYHGLQLAFTHRYKPLEVNLDVHAIITISQTSHPLYSNLTNDCRFLLAHLDDPVVLYTYREQNQVLTFERPLCATQGMGTNSSSFSKDPLLSRPILRSPP